MKTQKIVLTAMVALIMLSCSPTVFYQVYKTAPATGQGSKQDATPFENERIRVEYDFWEDGGKNRFTITNKTKQDMFIDKTECFFVINGYSFPFYQNRVFTIGKGGMTTD